MTDQLPLLEPAEMRCITRSIGGLDKWAVLGFHATYRRWKLWPDLFPDEYAAKAFTSRIAACWIAFRLLHIKTEGI